MTITDEIVERAASSILKAAGNGLRLHTPINQAKILKATRAALEAALSGKDRPND